MKVFVAVLAVLALASADQSSHQTIKHGNAPAVHTSIHKPHGIPHAKVISQPSAQPNEVHQYHNEEKYPAANHAPAHQPHYAVGPVHAHAPVYHAAPAYKPALPYAPAPAYKPAPAPYKPVYKPAPAPYKPVYKPAPAPYKPTPAPYKPAPVHYKPAPAPYKPAPYHEPAYEAPAVYNFGYAVADDYSGANFAANENRDNYATNGEYRVALPDGRTQIVTYSVADAYSGYVADVRYEGEAQYPEYKPAYKPAPAYHQ